MKKSLLVALVVAASILSFQNCSKVTFESVAATSLPDGTNSTLGTSESDDLSNEDEHNIEREEEIPPSVVDTDLLPFPPGGEEEELMPEPPTVPPVVGPVPLPPTPPPAPECRFDSVIQNQFLKVIFLVDLSTSNRTTDPDTDQDLKPRRMMALNSILTKYPAGEKLHIGIVGFGGSRARSYVSGGMSGDRTHVAVGLENFKLASHYGGTPYGAAIHAAQSMINQDSEALAQYHVIMITDGKPTGAYRTFEEMQTEMMAKVQSLTSTPNKKVVFHTVFYYNTEIDQQAQSLLREMALLGGGSAITASQNQTIDLPTQLAVTKEICQ